MKKSHSKIDRITSLEQLESQTARMVAQDKADSEKQAAAERRQMRDVSWTKLDENRFTREDDTRVQNINLYQAFAEFVQANKVNGTKSALLVHRAFFMAFTYTEGQAAGYSNPPIESYWGCGGVVPEALEFALRYANGETEFPELERHGRGIDA